MDDNYKIVDYLDNSVIALKLTDSAATVLPHSHEFIEMIYICKGSAEHHYSDKHFSLKSGDYTFVDSNSVHSFIKKSRDFCAISCLFVPGFIDASLKNRNTISDILKSHMVGIYSDEYTESVFCDSDGSIKNELENMLDEFRKKRSGYIQMIRSSLVKVLICSARSLVSVKYSRNPIIQQIIDCTNTEYYKSGSLSDFAKQFSYSPSRLSTLFKQSVGINYSEYLCRTRINISCNMLEKTALSIESIASLVGYNDVRAYRKNFKRLMQIPPLRYRKNAKAHFHLCEPV